MKNKILIFLGVVLTIAIISLSYIFVINNGKKDIKESSQIKELTQEEKTSLIDAINEAYILKNNVASEKYDQKILEINDKYTAQINEINVKYEELEKQINEEYYKQDAEIDSQIDALRRQQTTEFFNAGGITEKYDQIGAQIKDLQNKSTDLWLKNVDDKRANTSKKNEELSPIDGTKNREKSTIEDNRTTELNQLKINKDKEIAEVNNNTKNKNVILLKGILKICAGIVIILVPFLYLIITFNRLTHLRNKSKESWAQIDVLLKKRSDLIPNIVESVKGFSKHEKSTLSDVTKARNGVINANGKQEEIDANNKLSSQIGRIFALVENYPELKANTGFMDLQENLKKIEDQLAYYRQDYNRSVLKYKNKLEFFPSNIVGVLFRFEPELFFDTEDEENVKVKF